MKVHVSLSSLMVILLLISMVLPGCGNPVPAETTAVDETVAVPDTTAAEVVISTTPSVSEEITLRVLADSPSAMPDLSMMTKLISKIARTVEANYDGLEVQVEYLPTDDVQRATMLEAIRGEIAAGGGPDAFLFSRSQPSPLPFAAESIVPEPLFPDVVTAMNVGYFADLSEYYNGDTRLHKDGFASGVMEAGVIGDVRYVLPLRYNFPVAYVDMEKFADTGLSTDIFSSGGNMLLRTLVENEVQICVETGKDPLRTMVCSLLPDPLTAEDLTDYMTRYQVLLPTLDAATYTTDLSTVIAFQDSKADMYWGNDEFSSVCIQIGMLENAVEQSILAQISGIELGMFPITNPDGTLIADVNCYGAVNANCGYPEVAYAFISAFLTEDAQWEKNITTNGVSFNSEMMADGYPVLTNGSAEAIFAILNCQPDNSEIQVAVDALEINDEDVPILHLEVEARFPTWAERDLENKLKDLLDTPVEELPGIAQAWLQIQQS